MSKTVQNTGDKTADGQLPCRVAIERTNEHFYAHTVYLGGPAFQPGDVVHMQGDDIHVQTGAKFMLRRRAKVRRAGWLRRQWTKFVAIFEITGLYEVSFSERKKP